MNQQELDELYFAALRVEEAGDYEKALEMFRRGAQFGDHCAFNAIGIAYDAGNGVKQDKEHAIEWFKRAYNDGENICYCANIALTYAQIGQLEFADEWWNRAMESDDKSASLEYAKFSLKHGRYQSWQQIMGLLEVTATARARFEVSEDEKEEAQKLLNGLRTKQTPDEIAEIWRAHEKDQMFEQGGETAKTYFSSLAQVDPHNKSARFFLMLLAIDERDLHSALAYANEVKKLSPQDPNLNLNIGRIYELAGTYDKAIAFYKRELALFPDNELAFFNLGTTFFKLRRWNKAIFYFKKAAAFNAEWHQESLSRLAMIYERIGAVEKERQMYRKMIARDADWAAPLQNLGATYIDTRDYARALEILGRAKTMDASDAMIDRNIAKAARGLAIYAGVSDL